MFYDTFKSLCDEKGVSVSKACLEMGLSRSIAAKWKTTKTNPSAEVIPKIAKYFGVTTDYLLGAETEKTPISEDGREEDLKLRVAAYWGGGDDLSQEELDGLWNDAESYYKFKLEQMRQKKRSKQ